MDSALLRYLFTENLFMQIASTHKEFVTPETFRTVT